MNKKILSLLFFSFTLAISALSYAGGTDIHGGAPKPMPRPPNPGGPKPPPSVVLQGPVAADFFAEMVYLHREFYQTMSIEASECTMSSTSATAVGAGSLSINDQNQNLDADDAQFLCQALSKAGVSQSRPTDSFGFFSISTGKINCVGTPVTECDIWLP